MKYLVTNEYSKDTLTQCNRSQDRLFATRIGTKALTGIFYIDTSQKQRFGPSLTWDLENKETKNICSHRKLIVGKTVRMLVSGAANG